eukprot:GEZU01005989.1.p2 GENE.GEZU01005989.1~~GEZU01005989.1.p2  ORF type:complete len:148 (-),score=40.96 GEZU01005989.1:96-539(-)
MFPPNEKHKRTPSKYADSGWGKSLNEILALEDHVRHEEIIPMVVRMCITYLWENGLNVETIFSRPGSIAHVTRFKEMFEEGEHVDFYQSGLERHFTAQVAASLLKTFLRELKDPLFDPSDYNTLITASQSRLHHPHSQHLTHSLHHQ